MRAKMIIAPWKTKLPFFINGKHKPIITRIEDEAKQGYEFLPTKDKIFNAYNNTPPENTSVVIIGQDPYPTPTHPIGLSFSVKADITPLPRSLINIFRELEEDTGNPAPVNGDLSHWAKQGVLLLNTALTVRAGDAGSHSKYGWEELTDETISFLSENYNNIVFILWGGHARKKVKLINQDKHCIIQSAHPSPLSSYRGFFGSKPFSKTNEYLEKHGKSTIKWS